METSGKAYRNQTTTKYHRLIALGTIRVKPDNGSLEFPSPLKAIVRRSLGKATLERSTTWMSSGQRLASQMLNTWSLSAATVSSKPGQTNGGGSLYTDQTRVLHVGNVAHTGFNLVSQARSEGKQWALRTIPAAPSLRSPSAWVARGADALRYSLGVQTPDLAHVHYGPNGYYGFLKSAPMVLHLHGTDLRQDLHRPLLGNLEHGALRHAEAVIVATPDLLEAAQQERSDAVFIPNPVPLALVNASPPPLTPTVASLLPQDYVFFSARWDDSKGGMALVELAEDLVRDGVNVLGVDWGTYSRQATQAGVKMLPLLPVEQFHAVIAKAAVVVGQFTIGALTISELSALALARPVVSWADPLLEGEVPLCSAQIEHAASQIKGLLKDPSEAAQMGELGKQWVYENRHPSAAVGRLEDLYRAILA